MSEIEKNAAEEKEEAVSSDESTAVESSNAEDKRENKDDEGSSGKPEVCPSSVGKSNDVAEEKDIKGHLRKHGLSTGILIIWLMAIAAICIIIGGFAGAAWQKGVDERAFNVERNALNEKISTLESKAEEDQKELVELREFRKKLEDLVTEYIALDAKRQSEKLDNANSNQGNGAANVNGNAAGVNVNAPTQNGNVNSGTATADEPNFFERLFGFGSIDENENKDENVDNTTNTNAHPENTANENTSTTNHPDSSEQSEKK